MASFKFPDISISAIEAGKAMKKLSEAMRRRETNEYIFIVQISCIFPLWYYYSSPTSIKSIPPHTLKRSYAFNSIIPIEQIKKEILNIEETLIKTYEAEIKEKYGIKYDRKLRRLIEYELEVRKNNDLY